MLCQILITKKPIGSLHLRNNILKITQFYQIFQCVIHQKGRFPPPPPTRLPLNPPLKSVGYHAIENISSYHIIIIMTQLLASVLCSSIPFFRGAHDKLYMRSDNS